MQTLEISNEIKRELFLRQEIIEGQDLLKFIPFISPEYKAPLHLLPLIVELEAILFKDEKRLITLSAPPQHYKTTTIEHFLALAIKIKPKVSIVIMSYNETFATDRIVNIITLLKKMGIKPNPMKSGKTGYMTESGASLIPAGIETGYTGRPADITIIDDPIRTLDDVTSVARTNRVLNTFKGVTETREQNKSSVIVTHTRWHKNDLIGWIQENRKRYLNINIPVLIDGKPLLPEKMGLEMIDIRRLESPDVFKAMYMGVPPNSMSALFRTEVNGELLPKYFTDIPNEYEAFSIGGDLAYTDKTRADYTVVVRGYKAQGKIYIDHVERWQQDIIYTKDRLKQIYNEYHAPIQLEDNGVQKGIVDMLVNEGIYINRQKVDASKYTRALEFASQWNLGNVYIRRADWNSWFVKELFDFTGSGKEHDDIVDACVYMFRGLQSSLAFA